MGNKCYTYQMSDRPMLVLAILDGWGVGRPDFTNPLTKANLKTIPYIEKRYRIGSLQASSISVGLPWNDVGNSEVGHLTIGAGKVLYQHYPRITLAIEKGEFQKNPVFTQMFEHVKKHNSALNLASLLTEGTIHAAFEHLGTLIEMAAAAGVKQVNLHLFADGKDSRPRSLLALLTKLRQVTAAAGVGTLATLIGRHFALDRDNHWDRTHMAYDAMVGAAASVTRSTDELISQFYQGDVSDEYFPATSFGSGSVKDGDAIFFCDFREDSIRQIASSFIDKDFDKFPAKKFSNLFIATMTEYTKHFGVPVAFPPEDVTNPLGRVLSDNGLKQLLIAETEKYAHVSYFFNGYRDEPFAGQTKVLIPSRNVERHDMEPEMMASGIADRVVEALQKKMFDVIVLNFANADMVAHTGNFAAGITAVETVDQQLGRIVQACEQTGSYLVVTADHGNVEVMLDPMTGNPETSHDPSPVPIYIIGKGFERESGPAPDLAQQGAIGILSDVAPTILELLSIPKPPEMTGQSLTSLLQ
jgi:2,3-bisphosphoglycerate-independent phosphoglycerate mutase